MLTTFLKNILAQYQHIMKYKSDSINRQIKVVIIYTVKKTPKPFQETKKNPTNSAVYARRWNIFQLVTHCDFW